MIIRDYLRDPAKYAILSLAAHGYLNWMPDDMYLRCQYWAHMKRKLNLKDPKTFNEKLQWLKLYDRKPIYTTMVDKYAVKKYVADLIGGEYIIPTLGVWDSFDQIDFDSLPDQFVLKCTHDSGGLVICRDKSKLDKAAAKRKIEASLKQNYYWNGREWPYKDVKPRIIAEHYMEDENLAQGLTDYKFFCFNGKPQILYVSQGLENHASARISFYDMQGTPMPFCREDFKPLKGTCVRPDNFEQMGLMAKKLAAMVGSPFVRVDLYSIMGKVYFSEITFFPCSGMIPFSPAHWDAQLGEWIDLPKDKQ